MAIAKNNLLALMEENANLKAEMLESSQIHKTDEVIINEQFNCNSSINKNIKTINICN